MKEEFNPEITVLSTLTLDQVKAILPSSIRSNITEDFVDKLNSVSQDPIIAEEIRNNFISYSKVISDGRYKIIDYLNAVKYVTHKIMGASNQEAYKKTFPDRYLTLIAKGADEKSISCYVAMYNSNKLVTLLLDQTLIPVYIMNRDIHQEAINTLASLMRNAKSEKVRCESANHLLVHLKKPESKVIELDIGFKESSGLNELNNALKALAEKQIDLIKDGTPTSTIAKQSLIVQDKSKRFDPEYDDYETITIDELEESILNDN